jgi:hypothetical protein
VKGEAPARGRRGRKGRKGEGKPEKQGLCRHKEEIFDPHAYGKRFEVPDSIFS